MLTIIEGNVTFVALLWSPFFGLTLLMPPELKLNMEREIKSIKVCPE